MKNNKKRDVRSRRSARILTLMLCAMVAMSGMFALPSYANEDAEGQTTAGEVSGEEKVSGTEQTGVSQVKNEISQETGNDQSGEVSGAKTDASGSAEKSGEV
ncbi:MAG: hypothetical protein ACI4LM_02290, partial [Anaerovoracaceae bacterium]